MQEIQPNWQQPIVSRPAHQASLDNALGYEAPPPGAVFVAELFHATPRVYITPLILAANVIVYLVMVLSGVDWAQPGSDAILRWGATSGRPPPAASGGV